MVAVRWGGVLPGGKGHEGKLLAFERDRLSSEYSLSVDDEFSMWGKGEVEFSGCEKDYTCCYRRIGE